jgi:hypothetical protein
MLPERRGTCCWVCGMRRRDGGLLLLLCGRIARNSLFESHSIGSGA